VDTKISLSAAPGVAVITPEKGSRTPAWLALSPEVAGVTGRYFDEKKETASSSLSYDRRIQERLWKMAEDLTGLGSSDGQG
jgi:hypothetical protein